MKAKQTGTLNYAEIDLLLAELRPWIGAIVQKIRQSGAASAEIRLRRPGENGLLQFRLQRGRLRFFLGGETPPALSRPPAFTMALRKHLAGKRLQGLTQPPGERVAVFSFARENDRVELVAELIPPGGNLVLLDGQARVLARLFGGGRNSGVGRPYEPPAPAPEDPRAAVRPWSGPSFHSYLAAEEAEAAFGASSTSSQAPARAQRIRKRLAGDWEKAGDPAAWRRDAELLMLHPQAETKGLHQISLVSPEGEERTIALNPARSRQEHIEHFFRKARKAERARKHIGERLRLLDSDENLVLGSAPLRPTQAASAPSKATSLPGHVFRFPGGSLVLAGRSAKENERITFGWAKAHDYWLHARDVTGSHVVARLAPGDDPETVLNDAARIALYYSARRNEADGDVRIARRKHVQSIKGAPGRVRILQEENRRVKQDATHWERIEGRRLRRNE